MDNSKDKQFVNDAADRVDESDGDVVDEDAGASSAGAEVSAIGNGSVLRNSRRDGESSSVIGLTERLTDIFVGDGDGDLLLQRGDREDGVIHWLQALDMQVMGACRADERLKPLLKLNVSTGIAEDALLTQLSQHFEPSEVGILARCLCIPLVSIRVGKINKQGSLLCPTATRGNLNVTLLPSSDLRVSFIGDDGHTDRLATLSSNSQSSDFAIEKIPTDKSGRSFMAETPVETFYYWCSEKSKLLGIELLDKMKYLLESKPSLAGLSGISDSRLGYFASHLRAYLVGPTLTNAHGSPVVSAISSLAASPDSTEFLPVSSRPSKSRHYSSQGAKPNSLVQGSLSPRSGSFKEGLPRTLSNLRSVAREKLRRRGDSQLLCTENPSAALSSAVGSCSLNLSEKDKLPEASGSCLFHPLNFLESFGQSADLKLPNTGSPDPAIDSPIFSPYYCWCPPVTSTLHYTVALPQLPISSSDTLPLPPLSSLLSVPGPSSLLGPTPPLSLTEVPSVGPFGPDPLVRLPLSLPTSQQIPTFTPLMCDPIVHIPVIDVCSSGQGYLVSAGASAISTSIPPLHPKLVSPLIPDNDSVLEKGARETLRLLINGSSQPNSELLDVLPSVLTSSDEKQGIVAARCRGLYAGARDVGSVASSIAAMRLVSLSDISLGNSVIKRCISQDDLASEADDIAGGSSISCSKADGFITPNVEEGTD